MSDLFPPADYIQPVIRKAWKAYKRMGFSLGETEHMCIIDLKSSGQAEFIPALKEQFRLLREEYDK